ncbi:MAG: hypothetical protein CM15mP74_26900 [Halieaceae bacterium]|nr:MAG: hypothetical protein CM15mP74_26900 [Halieaceae bacterium]
MANGEKLALTLRGDALYLNESVVIETDIEASNGVIHVIDSVLTPVMIPEPQGSIVDIALSNLTSRRWWPRFRLRIWLVRWQMRPRRSPFSHLPMKPLPRWGRHHRHPAQRYGIAC